MKNQKGISLIALIITIIVIIILAAIVIGSAVRTPESANWAKFCGNYAEVQSAVSTKTAEAYGKLMLNAAITTKPSMEQVLYNVVTTGTEITANVADGSYPSFAAGSNAVTIAQTNQLGLSGYTVGATEWAVTNDGVLYSQAGVTNPNDAPNKYVTPTVLLASTPVDLP